MASSATVPAGNFLFDTLSGLLAAITALRNDINALHDGTAPRTLTTGVAAAGTNLAGATVLTAGTSVIATAAASSGVALPAPVAGAVVRVFNQGANTVTVYAPTGCTVNGGASVTIAATKATEFVGVSATSWLTQAGA